MTEEEYIQSTVECIERLRKQYPDSAYVRIVKDVCESLLTKYDKHIAKKRNEYNRISSFKEKKKYYDEVLSSREKGYILATQAIRDYLKHGKPRPYEAWVLPPIYEHMKTRGYKAMIELYINDIIQ